MIAERAKPLYSLSISLLLCLFMLKPVAIEKAVAILLLLWSLFILYTIFASLQAYVEAGILHWRDISVTGVLAMAHYRIAIPLLSICASILLLAGKRKGWIACIVMNFINAIFVCISVFSSDIYTEHAQSVYINGILIALAFTGMGILLLNKDIRLRYAITAAQTEDSETDETA
jgi:hypothetical protein